VVRKDSAYWLRKLATLRVDRARGDPAPHKPLLLLVVLEMAERGETQGEKLPLSADLAFRFSAFWSVVAHRRRQTPDVRLPFHHVGSSGIWHPVMADGRPSPTKELTTGVQLDPSFLACVGDDSFRDRARRVLIETDPYFRTDERPALYSLLRMEPATKAEPEDPDAAARNMEEGRDARFRIEVVVVAYRHTCALTGYRMNTITMESIVDAAHIHEFKDSRNNDPRNGLALSKNSHWQFDRGLWSVGDDYRVIVNRERFVEEGVPGQRLSDFEGRRLFLPSDPRYWPEQAHPEWHRTHKLRLV
jgi:putative restriction endonuclease